MFAGTDAEGDVVEGDFFAAHYRDVLEVEQRRVGGRAFGRIFDFLCLQAHFLSTLLFRWLHGRKGADKGRMVKMRPKK